MRPPQVLVISAIIGTISCHDKKHQVNLSVVVAIVVFKVDVSISLIQCIDEYFPALAILHISVILAVVYSVGTDNIELWLELTSRVVCEIVTYTTGSLIVVISRIVLLIHHVVDNRRIIFA